MADSPYTHRGSFSNHKEQFPETYPSDDPAEVALLAATVAEINDGCPWGACTLKAHHSPLDNFIVTPTRPADPRDAAIADIEALLTRIEALVVRLERMDAGNGIEILARDGR